MQIISVTHAETGWAVGSEAIEGPLVFRSGAKAEAAAKQLARALVAAGDPVRIDIRLRNASRAGGICSTPRRRQASRPCSSRNRSDGPTP